MKIELGKPEQEITKDILEKQEEPETVRILSEEPEAEEVIYSAPKR